MCVCSHALLYLRKRRGEDNRKRGHVLEWTVYCCSDITLVTRKAPETGLSTTPDMTFQGFQWQVQGSKEETGMRWSQMGILTSLEDFLFGCSQSSGWTRRDLQAKTCSWRAHFPPTVPKFILLPSLGKTPTFLFNQMILSNKDLK